MYRIFSCLFVTIVLFWDVRAEAPRYINQALLEEIKDSPSFSSIRCIFIERGETAAKQSPIVITDKLWSFSNNVHYYNTMAPYWWPEESNGKIVYVNKDGLINPQCNELDRMKIQHLADRLKNLCYAYYLTLDHKYYKAFVKQLDAWFIKKATLMYPNFEYAQVIPGNAKGRPVGLIEAHAFNYILDYIRIVDSCKSIGKRRYEKIAQWFMDLARWMENSDLGKQDSLSNSNQGVSYDITLFNIYLFLGDYSNADMIVKSFPQKRIYKQIESDGKQPLELIRSNAYQYSLGNLDYFIQFCLIAESAGYHVYENHAERINAAIRYLYSFIGKTASFPYQQIAGWDGMERKLCRLVLRSRRLNPSIESDIGLSTDVINRYTKGWTDL